MGLDGGGVAHLPQDDEVIAWSLAGAATAGDPIDGLEVLGHAVGMEATAREDVDASNPMEKRQAVAPAVFGGEGVEAGHVGGTMARERSLPIEAGQADHHAAS